MNIVKITSFFSATLLILFGNSVIHAQIQTSSSGRVDKITTDFTSRIVDGQFNREIFGTGWISGVGDYLFLKHGGSNVESDTYGFRISDGKGFEFGKNNFSVPFLNIKTNGNIGVGTSNSEARLHIKTGLGTSQYPTISSKGDMLQFLESGNNGIEIGSSDESNARRSWILARHHSNAFGKYYSTLHLQPDVGDKSQYKGVAIGFNANTELPVSTHLAINGKVGIGTTNTTGYSLSVNGNIRATEVKVYTGWADYVFKDDYQLPTLAEVAQHIAEKGHLINIPSEAEVAENGIQLGEMNAKLLEKIEELTLYTLQQEKQLKEQKSEIENLKKQNTRITDLEEKLNSLLQK